MKKDKRIEIRVSNEMKEYLLSLSDNLTELLLKPHYGTKPLGVPAAQPLHRRFWKLDRVKETGEVVVTDGKELRSLWREDEDYEYFIGQD